MKKCFRLLSLLLAVCMLFTCAEIGIIIPKANAATFEDINQPSVFIKQHASGYCTLAAAVMMARRYAILRGDADWAKITEASAQPDAWMSGSGLKHQFSLNLTSGGTISVQFASLPGGDRTTVLCNLLNEHPEGIFIYRDNVHGVLLTDYTNGVFYCADPAYGDKRPLTSAASGVRADTVNCYWYVTSPRVYFSNYPDPDKLMDIGNWAYASIYHKASGKNITVDVSTGSVCMSDSNDPNDLRQLWYISKEGGPDGSYQIKSAYDGRCLDAAGWGTVNGTNVQICADSDNTAQRWYLYNIGEIRPSYSYGLAMDLDNNSTAGGTNVQLWSPNGTEAQNWGIRIVPVLLKTEKSNGHTYELYGGGISWKEAKVFAEEKGGHLATVTSAAEQSTVQSLMADDLSNVPVTLQFDSSFETKKLPDLNALWIGATDEAQEGVWQWVTGEPFNYTNWHPEGEPNNWQEKEHYAQIYIASGYWNDIELDPSTVNGFIVEYEPTVPAVPAGVTAKPTASKTLTVSWKASEGATQYNIYRYNGEKKEYVYKGTTFATVVMPLQYVDAGLNAGTTYYYKVVAVNKSGGKTYVSAKSAAASAKAVATPAVPTGVKARATTAKTLTVSWTAVKNATQYNVYRYNSTKKEYVYKGTTFATAAKPTQYVDKNLYAGTTYYYKVVAVTKEAGLTLVSGKSAAANAKVVGTPAVPTGVMVKPTASKTLTVSWTAVKNATQYNVYRYNSTKKEYVYKGTTFATAAKPTQYVDKNLYSGTTYYYKVVAVTKDAGLTLVSGKSAAASAKAVGTPAVPATVAAIAAKGQITMLWTESAGATQYNIYRYNSTKKEYVYKGTSYGTSFVDSAVTAGTTYYYKVVAVTKEAGLTLVGAYSAAVNAKAK